MNPRVLNWLPAVLLAVVGAVVASSSGCGGDDCSRAVDHANACLNIPSSTSVTSTTGGQPASECTGLTACAAVCVNDASCDEIVDAHQVPPGPTATSLLACEQQCELDNGINTASYDPIELVLQTSY